jgi:protein TonB
MAEVTNLSADLDEIIFRSRNREYGAYDLRRIFPRNMGIAFAAGMSLILLLILATVLSKYLGSGDSDEAEVQEVTASLSEPPPLDDKQPEEIKVEPPPPPLKSEVKFVPPEIVEHEKADPEVKIIEKDSLLEMKADIGSQNVQGDDDAPPNIGYVEEKGTGTAPVEVAPVEKDPEPDEFVAVEKQPDPVNLADIKKAIVYPPIAKDNGIQGKVFIRMLVNKEGIPEKHIVVKSPHELLTKACVDQIYKLRFTPGIQAGKPIKVWVMIPFDFSLRN